MRDGAVEEEVDDIQEVRGSDPCKGGEITYFSGELWWNFVRSPLSLAVNLHNFTAFTAFHRQIMYEICGEKTNFSPLILYIFAFFFSTRAAISWPSYACISSLELNVRISGCDGRGVTLFTLKYLQRSHCWTCNKIVKNEKNVPSLNFCVHKIFTLRPNCARATLKSTKVLHQNTQ